MPSKKKPLTKPKCTISSRRVIETVPIEELRHPAVNYVPRSKQVNEPSPAECGSCGIDEDVGASGTCCSDPQCEENTARPLPEQELKTRTCLPECQASQVEAMIDEIRNCREIIRSLALEAMDILHPENSQQYKQVQAQQGLVANGVTSCQQDAQQGPIGNGVTSCQQDAQQGPIANGVTSCQHDAQQGPIANGVTSCQHDAQQGPIANGVTSCQHNVQQGPLANGMTPCQHDDDSGAKFTEPAFQAKPIDQGPKTDCSKKKCEISDIRKYSGSEGQSTTRLLPPILSKSPTLSRKSSGPIAQAAHQIKEKRLGQNLVRKKPSNCSCDEEKKQNVDCSCDETMNKKALGFKPSECSCDGEKMKKADCKCDDKPENKTDCKTIILNTFGKKPSECRCDGEKNKKENCKCDDTIKKRNKENEKRAKRTDSKSFLQKTFGWKSCDSTPPPVVVDNCVCDDEEMEKQNKYSQKEKRKAASACPMPKCAANTCTCHFPPAYNQYFNCTGHVSGNCHCDKNA